jgi:hypothetical protein
MLTLKKVKKSVRMGNVLLCVKSKIHSSKVEELDSICLCLLFLDVNYAIYSIKRKCLEVSRSYTKRKIDEFDRVLFESLVDKVVIGKEDSEGIPLL